MGWVSLTENAIERMSSEVAQLRQYSSETISSDELLKNKQIIFALIRNCESFIRDIRKYLDIATDPKLDLVDELIGAENRIRELERETKELPEIRQVYASLKEKHSTLHKNFDELNGKSARRFAEIKEIEKKYDKLEKEYARLERSKRR